MGLVKLPKNWNNKYDRMSLLCKHRWRKTTSAIILAMHEGRPRFAYAEVKHAAFQQNMHTHRCFSHTAQRIHVRGLSNNNPNILLSEKSQTSHTLQVGSAHWEEAKARRGGSAGARFPCLVSRLTASCAATTTTTTSWICYVQLD